MRSLNKVFLALLLLGTNHAALAALTSEESSSNDLEEIVVTSQKVQQDLRDVPMSITVISGAQLEERHVDGYDDITRIVPGVSFSAGTGPTAGTGVGSEGIIIRGIGSQLGTATVGIYVDDVSVTVPAQGGTFAPKLFDLERVEVLRGPQGTLYGASSEGGTIRFITNQPKLDTYELKVTGDVSGTVHGGVNTDDSVVFNVPIVAGELALRGGVEILSQSGWINRYQHPPGDLLDRTDQLVDSGTNSEHDVVVHVAATYKPSSALSITPSFIYQREEQNDTPAFYFGEGTYNQSKSINEYARDTDYIPSLTINASSGLGQLTSVTSYFNRQYDHARDGTYYDPDYLVPDCLDVGAECGNNANPIAFTTPSKASVADATLAMLPTTALDSEHTTVATEELRFVSPTQAQSGIPFNWILGLYASRTTDDVTHNEIAPGWDNLFEQIYGFSPNNPVLSPISDVTNPNLWQNDNFYYFHTSRGYKQLAGFGQIDYSVLPNLTASAGLRYQHTDLSYTRFGAGFYDIGVQHNYSTDSNDHALTPKFTLKYDLTDTTNIYASAAQGYRDGGINDPIPQSLCAPYEKQVGITGAAPSSYDPDHLWSYELGIKGLFDDRQLSVNADVYTIRWSSIQQQIFIPVCTFAYITNVGDARAYGTELEILYKVSAAPGLTVGLNGSAEHAYITASSGSGGASEGEDLLFTPKWTAVATVDYRTHLTNGLLGYARADFDWTGPSTGDFLMSATDHINRQYAVVNASIGVTTTGGFDVQLYAKNLFDDKTIIREPTIADVTEAYTVRPLTIGLKAQKKF
jgi:outer membrane receptor protein involved in Fe transport